MCGCSAYALDVSTQEVCSCKHWRLIPSVVVCLSGAVEGAYAAGNHEVAASVCQSRAVPYQPAFDLVYDVTYIC